MSRRGFTFVFKFILYSIKYISMNASKVYKYSIKMIHVHVLSG